MKLSDYPPEIVEIVKRALNTPITESDQLLFELYKGFLLHAIKNTHPFDDPKLELIRLRLFKLFPSVESYKTAIDICMLLAIEEFTSLQTEAIINKRLQQNLNKPQPAQETNYPLGTLVVIFITGFIILLLLAPSLTRMR